jgi:hypothetical protein
MCPCTKDDLLNQREATIFFVFFFWFAVRALLQALRRLAFYFLEPFTIRPRKINMGLERDVPFFLHPRHEHGSRSSLLVA